jgi:hypothetical protein
MPPLKVLNEFFMFLCLGEEGMDQVHTAEAPEQKVGDINTITYD